MNRYAAALSQHPIPAHAVGEVAGSVLEQLDGEPPDLVVYFVSPHFVGAFDDMTAALRAPARTGCADRHDHRRGRSAVRSRRRRSRRCRSGRRCLDGPVTPVGLQMVNTPDGPAVSGWPTADEVPDEDAHTLLLLADPFTFPVEAFLARLAEDRPELQVIGGMASAAAGPGGNRLVLDGELRHEGAVGVLLGGAPRVRAVVSQGCRPVGSAYIVTDAEDNVVRELGGKPALERLAEVASVALRRRTPAPLAGAADRRRRRRAPGRVRARRLPRAQRARREQAGRVDRGRDERRGRDDRAVPGARRDRRRRGPAGAARRRRGEERAALHLQRPRRAAVRDADHDAELVEEMLGPIPVAGAFCAGEIGPVGGRNFVHGFTASLALFDG